MSFNDLGMHCYDRKNQNDERHYSDGEFLGTEAVEEEANSDIGSGNDFEEEDDEKGG